MNKSNYNLTKLNNGLKALNISSTDDQIDRLVRFYEMVVETNKVMNLTSITDWDEFVDKHFLDSLVLESVFPEVKDVNKAIDIGTGAGFPGIPLAIMYPNIEFTLLDTLTKRINFLDEVCKELELDNISLIAGRAEDYGKDSSYREQYDLCVTRAVAEINVLSEFTIPFVKENGKIVFYKSNSVKEELEQGNNSINTLGGKLNNNIEVLIPNTEYKRNIIIIDKVENTPSKYPRKAGIPKKRPL